jgi:hypothetical protein
MKIFKLKLKKISSFVHGFSIIEIIIYLAIFIAISILVINSFIIILSSFSSIKINHDLVNAGSNSMERISREIRQAKNINLLESTFDSDSSVLNLTDVDGSSYVVFDKNGDDLRISKNDIDIGNLLVKNISLSKLIFRKITTTNGEAIKIEIELQDTLGKTIKTERFYDTVVLRGSY